MHLLYPPRPLFLLLVVGVAAVSTSLTSQCIYVYTSIHRSTYCLSFSTPLGQCILHFSHFFFVVRRGTTSPFSLLPDSISPKGRRAFIQPNRSASRLKNWVASVFSITSGILKSFGQRCAEGTISGRSCRFLIGGAGIVPSFLRGDAPSEQSFPQGIDRAPLAASLPFSARRQRRAPLLIAPTDTVRCRSTCSRWAAPTPARPQPRQHCRNARRRPPQSHPRHITAALCSAA